MIEGQVQEMYVCKCGSVREMWRVSRAGEQCLLLGTTSCVWSLLNLCMYVYMYLHMATSFSSIHVFC